MTDDDLIELQIPPLAEYVGTARLFVAAAGRHFELSEESVADVKVAVSEVCADAIEDRPHPDHLTIAIRAGLEALEVAVSSQAVGIVAESDVAADFPAPSFEHLLREPLVHALFPDAHYEPDEHSLRLSVPWDMPGDDEEVFETP